MRVFRFVPDRGLDWLFGFFYWLSKHWPFYWSERRAQRDCFHHELGGGFVYPVSHIHRKLIDAGKRKMFECSACGKVWLT